ncbi:MAG: hypothetical protein IKU67_01170 [Firmicutes bacterium]|nr:hypothetical protein [Bacillota bacterium]
MSKIKKGLFFILLQTIIFYAMPVFAGPTDIMGLVILQFGLTFALSVIVGAFTKSEMKFIFPIIASVGFIPAIMLYMNYTAYIYLVFYAVITVGGVAIGTGIRKLFIKE